MGNLLGQTPEVVRDVGDGSGAVSDLSALRAAERRGRSHSKATSRLLANPVARQEDDGVPGTRRPSRIFRPRRLNIESLQRVLCQSQLVVFVGGFVRFRGVIVVLHFRSPFEFCLRFVSNALTVFNKARDLPTRLCDLPSRKLQNALECETRRRARQLENEHHHDGISHRSDGEGPVSEVPRRAGNAPPPPHVRLKGRIILFVAKYLIRVASPRVASPIERRPI